MAKRKARGEAAKAAPPSPPEGGEVEVSPEAAVLATAETEAERLLRAACAKQGVEPESLIDFKVYPDKVALILLDFRKIEYSYADLIGFFRRDSPRRDSPANTLKQ